MIRVAIVEDEELFREHLKETVDATNDLQTIAVFEDAESFGAAFMDLNVDVVLMDIQLPGKSGIQSIFKWKHRKPHVQFLMCTVLGDDDSIFDSLCAGATGYLLKLEPTEQIQQAIRNIYAGGSPMSATIARQVLKSFQKISSAPNETDKLTRREWDVLQKLDKGFRYKEIADQFTISTTTVQGYVRNIYEKLQVHSRTEALNKAFRKN